MRPDLSAAGVSRETAEKLELFVRLLLKWQRRTNLVSAASESEIWPRHVIDSLQLFDLAPEAESWVDLGSGGGFPGIVLAIRLTQRGSGWIDLVESNAKKCAFLRTVIRETGAFAKVHDGRIEEVVPRLVPPEVVTARALAPLDRLCAYVHPLVAAGSLALFPKGQDVEGELTEARQSWRIDADLLPSVSSSDARVVRIRSLEPVTPAA